MRATSPGVGGAGGVGPWAARGRRVLPAGRIGETWVGEERARPAGGGACRGPGARSSTRRVCCRAYKGGGSRTGAQSKAGRVGAGPAGAPSVMVLGRQGLENSRWQGPGPQNFDFLFVTQDTPN